MKILRFLIGPLFWIGATWTAINYGPKMIAGIRSGKPLADAIAGVREEASSKNVLGESENGSENKIKLPNPPKFVQQVPEYVREIIKETTNQIIQTGSTTIQQTTENVTANVCQQIILEMQRQCNPELTPEPTKGQ